VRGNLLLDAAGGLSDSRDLRLRRIPTGCPSVLKSLDGRLARREPGLESGVVGTIIVESFSGAGEKLGATI